MKTKLFLLMCVLFVILAAVTTYHYYSYIFARDVQGEILRIERVTAPSTIITGTGNGAVPTSQLYSFAVAIRDQKSGEIVTASSEDRQWAVAGPGLCAEAKYYPYPFWMLDKSGTYFGARLLRLFDCPGKPAAKAARGVVTDPGAAPIAPGGGGSEVYVPQEPSGSPGPSASP